MLALKFLLVGSQAGKLNQGDAKYVSKPALSSFEEQKIEAESMAGKDPFLQASICEDSALNGYLHAIAGRV